MKRLADRVEAGAGGSPSPATPTTCAYAGSFPRTHLGRACKTCARSGEQWPPRTGACRRASRRRAVAPTKPRRTRLEPAVEITVLRAARWEAEAMGILRKLFGLVFNPGCWCSVCWAVDSDGRRPAGGIGNGGTRQHGRAARVNGLHRAADRAAQGWRWNRARRKRRWSTSCWHRPPRAGDGEVKTQTRFRQGLQTSDREVRAARGGCRRGSGLSSSGKRTCRAAVVRDIGAPGRARPGARNSG